ncbi:YjaG family protein [Gallaecimonas sp. GXIMD1310]|uniref:YjaG family protein n=1 Tax=Gallaecimonas sp. GXIMD1310 TaxID=3131926 RepID=UPI003253C0A9
MEKPLSTLPLLAQRAFAAALAQRMLPNFLLFAEITDQPEAGLAVKSALDTVWEKLLNPKAKISFEKQQLKLAELEPEPEQYDFFGAYPALDSYLAVMTILAAMQDKDEQPALDISRLSRGSVQFFLNTQAEQALDYAQLDQLELWQQERDFQDALLAAVSEPLTPEQLKAVQQLGRNEGVSNLGIALDDA